VGALCVHLNNMHIQQGGASVSKLWRSSCLSLAFAAALAMPAAAQNHYTDAEIRVVGHTGSLSVADALVVQSSQGYVVAPVETLNGTLLFESVGNKVRVTYGPLLEKGPSKPQTFVLYLGEARRVYVEICMNEDGVKYITHKPFPVPKRTGGKVRTLGGQQGVSAGPPSNDECSAPVAILVGDTGFDTTGSTASADVGDCFSGNNDIWYSFSSPGEGTLEVSTCGQAAYDTKLAMYDGLTCDPTTTLACLDDTGGCAGFSTTISAPVVAGDYLIRVGGFSTDTGSGTLTVTHTPPPGAANDECSGAALVDCGGTAFFDNSGFTDVGNPGGSACIEGLNRGWFKFVATGTCAVIDTEGSSVADTVLFLYDGDCGSLAELDCDDDGGSGFLSRICAGGLTAGTTYYVGVSSWDAGSIGVMSVNVSCSDAGEPGDTCADPLTVECGGSATLDNCCWVTDPDDLSFGCETIPAAGPGWMTFVATDTSALIDTNSSGSTDTIIAVYDGSCGSFVELACDDDGGDGFLSELCVEGLTVGNTYYIQVGSWDDDSRGSITVSLQCPCPLPPANDECENAQVVAVPSSTSIDNTFATTDFPPLCGDVTVGYSRNVWFQVTGTGGVMTANTCNAGTPGLATDTTIGVYCADCEDLVCVAGNDDLTCFPFGSRKSTATWCSQLGATYLITVGMFDDSAPQTAVQLDVSSSGGSCSGGVSCLPEGACCLTDGSCVVATAGDCTNLGGTYQGDDTDCTENIVADGGFNAGAFGGNWNESSTLFGTTICDVGCSGGLFARTGASWSWFGGAPGSFEEGSLSQTFVIPSNASSLDFYLDIQLASGNGTDFFEVTIDGIQVFSILENGAPAGYTLHQVPLGAFADDGIHTVAFHAVTDISAAFTNFMLDDVSVLSQVVACPQPTVVLGFCEDDGGNGLGNGQAITSPPEFGNLVNISASGTNAGAAIFDTTPSGPNDPSQDVDLLVDKNCILILQSDAASSQTGDFFDNPNDDEDGGTLTFDFLAAVEMLSVDLIDIDEGAQEASSVVLTDSGGNTRTFTIPAEWTEDLILNGPSGWRTLDLQDTGPQAGFASVATSMDVGAFDIADVARMDVNLGSSGGVDDVTFNNL
jgi:hypothetical protein